MTLTAPLDIASLLERIDAGWAPELLFFWGHTAQPGAAPGKECLSQWYPAPFVVDSEAYPTAEHYMMARKADLFGDAETAAHIRACHDPAEAKALGRRVRGFDSAVWDQHRSDIVTAGNLAKFSQNPALGAFLLATHERVLVEASPTDTIWGIGLAEDDARARRPHAWRGLNLLGFALMGARSQLRSSARR